MSVQSPMMRRIKTTRGIGSKLNVPRKGRIRTILIVIVLLIGAKVAVSVINNDNAGTTGKEKKSVQKHDRKKSDKTIVASKYPLNFEDISGILDKSSPDFTKTPDSLVYNGKNVFVHYSLDSSLQKLGAQLMKMYHPKYGAIVAINPVNGRVLSLISYVNDTCPDIGNNIYCQNTFPAASIYKTITAAAAIEKANYSSQSLLKLTGRKHTLYKFQLEKELKSYTEIPFEEAYAHSVNPIFARLGMYAVGQNSILEYGKKFGFSSAVPFELKNYASRLVAPDSQLSVGELASGFNEKTTLSPILGALIASAISEKGHMPRPSLVDSILSVDGSCLYRTEPQIWRSPIKETTARELRTMMHSVAKYGTARKSFKYIRQSDQFDAFEYGGKTGSVDKDTTGRVDWFIGFARNPSNPAQRIAVSAVTVHGAYWTVHSSFIAAEYFRVYMKKMKLLEQQKSNLIVKSDSSVTQPIQKAELNN